MMWWGVSTLMEENWRTQTLAVQGAWMMNRMIDTQQRHGMDTYGVSLYEYER
jgi:hypothetical protein